MFEFFKRLGKGKSLIRPFKAQVNAWHRANKKMKWGIPAKDFESLVPWPQLNREDQKKGFIGMLLCYGFGNDGQGNSDAVLSGKLAWQYAMKKWNVKVWQCQYIDFEKPENMRLRPGAPQRPQGFYTVMFNPGDIRLSQTVARFRKQLEITTGCGPEGIQLLTVTHGHLAGLMDKRHLPFMAFADYDVAPHGFYDFYDAVQMFSSQNTLGLGIGNIDNNYPLFSICEIRLSHLNAI